MKSFNEMLRENPIYVSKVKSINGGLLVLSIATSYLMTILILRKPDCMIILDHVMEVLPEPVRRRAASIESYDGISHVAYLVSLLTMIIYGTVGSVMIVRESRFLLRQVDVNQLDIGGTVEQCIMSLVGSLLLIYAMFSMQLFAVSTGNEVDSSIFYWPYFNALIAPFSVAVISSFKSIYILAFLLGEKYPFRRA